MTCRNLASVSVIWLACVLCVSAVRGEARITDLGGDRYEVVFRFVAPPGTKTVHLAGSFNGWDPGALAMEKAKDASTFKTTIVLAKGRHEYKFVLDGDRWMTDPDNPHRTEGYQNAVLFMGIEPGGPLAATPSNPEPIEMISQLEHPATIRSLAERLKEGTSADRLARAEKWLAENPMPLFTKKSVSFVFADGDASSVTLYIDAHGVRRGYALEPLAKGVGVFALTLDRSGLPERAAYTYEVQTGGSPHRVVDPHAWSLTSRSGRPAGWLVEASSARGRIEVIPRLAPTTGKLLPRDVYVYLPPGYDADPQTRYPVLYMHDGQNCWDDPVEPFNHGGWSVNLVADRLVADGKIEPFIGVGLANTSERMNEYGPGKSIFSDAEHDYLRFLSLEVKPLIDKRYRTKPDPAHTAIMGSSMGGIISLQAVLLKPSVFGQAACLSPAFQLRDEAAKDYFDLVSAVGKVPVRIYLDNGTAGMGQDGAPLTRTMAARLRELGWKDGEDLLHFEDTGAKHNERAWRARVHRPLVFMFGRK